MAAPVVQTVGTVSRTSASANVVIPKPTSLAVGDYMIALVGYREATSRTISTPSGWTLVLGAGGNTDLYVFKKTADSADVAAADFTFSASGNITYASGAILRITGQASGSEIQASETDFDNDTETVKQYTTNISPLTPNSLIVMAWSGWSTATLGIPTVSSYATTPTVTYTERADLGIDDGANGLFFGLATGTYTGSTTFTSRTATITESTASPGTNSIILIMNEVVNVTADVSHIDTLPIVTGVTASQVNVSTDVSHNAIVPTLEEITGKSSSDGTNWQNEIPPTTNWVNETL